VKGIIYSLSLLVLIILLITGCGQKAPQTKNINLPNIFSDNMVLQAKKPISIFGIIDPLTRVNMWIGDNSNFAVSDSSGYFEVTIDSMNYGGPHRLSLAGEDTICFNNVMIGEVWFCSGQSNMEWQVSQVNNSAEEIQAADYANIRLFSVPKKVSKEPLDDCESEWTTCNPKNIRTFSAVGYFFGRELYEKMNIPIGLIHSSWGGTPIEAWMKYNTLEGDSDFVPIVNRYKKNVIDYPEKLKEYNLLVEKIQNDGLTLPIYQVDMGNEGIKKGWANNNFDDSEWGNFELPGFWEGVLEKDIDGAIWFRKSIIIPENWKGKDLVIELGSIDDFDKTYINGNLIGEIDNTIPNFWTVLRVYNIDSENLLPGKNTIAVRVFDHFGQGGFSGAVSQLKLYSKDDPSNVVELAGLWKYKIENELDPKNITGPGGSDLPPIPLGPGHPHSPEGLYNGMIEPISPFTINGFIWYQGEDNASRAHQYRKLLPAMIEDWRTLWNDKNLYFGIVQLANFMSEVAIPTESSWAELREAQKLTSENINNSGLAVTIDIGEADDIHPKNKQDVGKRLAYWALNKAYGKKNFNRGTQCFSGPKLKEMHIDNDKVHMIFENIADSLVIIAGKELKGFAVAGKDRKFFWAKAKIQGDQVIAWSKEVNHPIAIRYAWANNPICNLYNSVGLPAGPFRTDNWQGITTRER